jgi:Uma2 family endonuclease
MSANPSRLERSDQPLAVDTASRGCVGYYPDLAVYCTDEVHPLDPETRIHPRLVVEVTSKSTERKDRGVKLEDYLQIPALEECLIVSHERRELELWTRTAEGWTRQLAIEGTLSVKSGASIEVEKLYDALPG